MRRRFVAVLQPHATTSRVLIIREFPAAGVARPVSSSSSSILNPHHQCQAQRQPRYVPCDRIRRSSRSCSPGFPTAPELREVSGGEFPTSTRVSSTRFVSSNTSRTTMQEPERQRFFVSNPRGGTLLFGDEARKELPPSDHKQNGPKRCEPAFRLPGVSTLLSRCSTSLSHSRGAANEAVGGVNSHPVYYQQGKSVIHFGDNRLVQATRSEDESSVWASTLADSRPCPHVKSSNTSNSSIDTIGTSKSYNILQRDHEFDCFCPSSSTELSSVIKRIDLHNKKTVKDSLFDLQRQRTVQLWSNRYSSYHDHYSPGSGPEPTASSDRKRGISARIAENNNHGIASHDSPQYDRPTQTNSRDCEPVSALQQLKPTTKSSRYLREMDRREILTRIARGEKQSALAKEFHVSRAAICSLNKHRDQVLSRTDENPFAKHPKKPRLAKQQLHPVAATSRTTYSSNDPKSTNSETSVHLCHLNTYRDPRTKPTAAAMSSDVRTRPTTTLNQRSLRSLEQWQTELI